MINEQIPDTLIQEIMITNVIRSAMSKEIKQNTASLFLEKLSNYKAENLNMECDTTQSSSQGTVLENINNNSIQKLQKFVRLHELEDPIFNTLKAEGPGHKLIHSVECVISTFKVKGTGKTKKIAKNIAAKQMLDKIEAIYEDLDTWTDTSKNLKTNNKLQRSKQKEGHLSNSCTSISSNATILAVLFKLIEQCEENITEEHLLKLKTEFNNVLKLKKITFYHMLLQSHEPKTYMLIVQLGTVPEILEIAMSDKQVEAELRTIKKVTQSLSKLDIFK